MVRLWTHAIWKPQPSWVKKHFVDLHGISHPTGRIKLGGSHTYKSGDQFTSPTWVAWMFTFPSLKSFQTTAMSSSVSAEAKGVIITAV